MIRARVYECRGVVVVLLCVGACEFTFRFQMHAPAGAEPWVGGKRGW